MTAASATAPIATTPCPQNRQFLHRLVATIIATRTHRQRTRAKAHKPRVMQSATQETQNRPLPKSPSLTSFNTSLLRAECSPAASSTYATTLTGRWWRASKIRLTAFPPSWRSVTRSMSPLKLCGSDRVGAPRLPDFATSTATIHPRASKPAKPSPPSMNRSDL